MFSKQFNHIILYQDARDAGGGMTPPPNDEEMATPDPTGELALEGDEFDDDEDEDADWDDEPEGTPDEDDDDDEDEM